MSESELYRINTGKRPDKIVAVFMVLAHTQVLFDL